MKKNNIRHINVFTGKRRYTKRFGSNNIIVCDMVKDHIHPEKNIAIKEIYFMINSIFEYYPFLIEYKDRINKDCIAININMLNMEDKNMVIKAKYTIISKLCSDYPFLDEHREFLCDEHGCFMQESINVIKNRESEIIILDVDDRIFEKITIDSEDYYIDNNSNIFDNEYIYVGFKKDNNIILFHKMHELFAYLESKYLTIIY